MSKEEFFLIPHNNQYPETYSPIVLVFPSSSVYVLIYVVIFIENVLAKYGYLNRFVSTLLIIFHSISIFHNIKY